MYCSGKIGHVIFDYNKRLILLFVIQLSGGHCTTLPYMITLRILRIDHINQINYYFE